MRTLAERCKALGLYPTEGESLPSIMNRVLDKAEAMALELEKMRGAQTPLQLLPLARSYVTSPLDLSKRARNALIVDLRRRGLTYDQIVARTGYCRSSVAQAVVASLGTKKGKTDGSAS